MQEYSFVRWLALREELWMTVGPQDSPGTKRKDAKDPYNHRFGGSNNPVVPVQQPGIPPTASKKMRSK
jgi:hypothetical protein